MARIKKNKVKKNKQAKRKPVGEKSARAGKAAYYFGGLTALSMAEFNVFAAGFNTRRV